MEFIEPLQTNAETEIITKINEIITAVNRLLATKEVENTGLAVLNSALESYQKSLD